MTTDATPAIRLRACNDAPPRAKGEYVLYWMIASRRPRWNFALQRAVELAGDAALPLLVLEPLRAGYRWASDRHHAFVIEGMRDNAAYFADKDVAYYPYVEPEHGAGSGLVEALAARAKFVVTDDWPCFFLPRMVAAVAKRLDVALEAVDSCGLLPLRATDRPFPTAHAFRRFLQRELPKHLPHAPKPYPASRVELPSLGALPKVVERRWPRASDELLALEDGALAKLAIDHDVGRVETRGGYEAALAALKAFVEEKLPRYADERNQPEQEVTSGLSPYLHYGHVSTHEVLHALAEAEDWSPDDVGSRTDGAREGWWSMSPAAEGFLDELVTWREVGFTACAYMKGYDEYASLPDWARKTLAEHESDEREHVYDLAAFEAAETHDELWNAAQTQLVREGRIHNYLRMLWGKKVLEWSATPRDALDVLIELNNKYAIDGRDPSSYSGIFWVLGRYDRAWGPERPIFGKIRYMTSQNTARKVRVKDYVRRYAPEGARGAEAGLFD